MGTRLLIVVKVDEGVGYLKFKTAGWRKMLNLLSEYNRDSEYCCTDRFLKKMYFEVLRSFASYIPGIKYKLQSTKMGVYIPV